MVRRLKDRLTFAGAVSATTILVALAGGTAYGDPSTTQDGASGDDFSGYIGLAEPGTSMAAPAKDRVGDRKAEGLGPVGERTSDTPDVPGEPVEDEAGSSGIEESPAPVGDSADRLRAAWGIAGPHGSSSP